MSKIPNQGHSERDVSIATAPSIKCERPSMYEVVMLNDDYTPMDFVVTVLKNYFKKIHDEAVRTMLDVHQCGQAVCGVYTREVAETKVVQVIDFARGHNYPLKCLMHKN